MAQFDVLWLRTSRGRTVLVVDVQADLLDNLDTRLVAPVVKITRDARGLRKLNPEVSIGDEPHYMVMQEVVSVRASALSAAGGDVSAHRDAIIAAVDLLVTGI